MRINVCNLNDPPLASNTRYCTTDIPAFLKKLGRLFNFKFGDVVTYVAYQNTSPVKSFAT